VGASPPGGGALLVLRGDASCLYEGHIFGTKYGSKRKYIFWHAVYLFEIFNLSLSNDASSEL
jgi:hypothetical protein